MLDEDGAFPIAGKPRGGGPCGARPLLACPPGMALGAAALLEDLPDRPRSNRASRGITSGALFLGT